VTKKKGKMVRMHNRRKIALFVSFSGQGGVERMIVNLSEGLIALGCQVNLLLFKARSRHLNALPEQANLVKLNASHTMTSLPELVRYLRREQPAALLATKDRGNQVAILARQLAGVSTRVVVRISNNVSSALEGKSRVQKWLRYIPIRLIYPMADEIVAVSHGVASDLARITGLPLERFQVIANPVITPGLVTLAQEPLAHPWFANAEVPVVLGVGRLTRQKDFSTLIKAFARVRAERSCRLVILGEGRDRNALEELAGSLALREDVDLPGFVDNPYAYMRRAALFVLSSAWEGSPNALTEALAIGVPVVATDCPSGPGEILARGRYGHLVPVGDVDALAQAMLATLAKPPDRAVLTNAVSAFTVEMSSRQYLATLLGSNNQN
jgi:glycosyltransferase involved in cell wall biosynthesis